MNGNSTVGAQCALRSPAGRPRRAAGAPGLWQRSRTASAVTLAILLAACGGASTVDSGTGTGAAADRSHAESSSATGTTRADAFRLLTQATFGPTDADIAHVMAVGPAAWLDEQLAKPVRAAHLARWNAEDRSAKAADPNSGATSATVDSSFYEEAMTDDDQLRQRMTFALSEIFVVSMQNLHLAGAKSQAVASYLDMLAQNSFGNYRALLEAVTLHPAMGQYLSAMANRMEAPQIGRIPDQNFARESMQLFSIGLVQLNLDGSAKPGAVATYGEPDIDGLSRVFTGFSWAGPDTSTDRFFNHPSAQAKNRQVTPMQPYPQYHSLSEKRFLGADVKAQTTADPALSLKIGLDTLAAHANVPPFISRQLIQRFVTSNPSAAYVSRVAAVFKDNGHGVRGDLKAVLRAILLDHEARGDSLHDNANYGKVREPVLRLTAFLRAYKATSDSGHFTVGATDDPGTELAQSPLRSRSVFNFYRPGYVVTGGASERAGLVLPEMQITSESSVAGYANYMTAAVSRGVGGHPIGQAVPRPDVQPDFTSAMALADDPAALVDDATARLIGASVDSPLKTQIVAAVTSIVVPALAKDGHNQAVIDRAHANRVHAAALLTLVSPEFVVQK